MWGATAGDIVGSRFEFNNFRHKEFEFFAPECCYTDDSVLTIAIAEVLLREGVADKEKFKADLVTAFHRYGKKYLSCGFGNSFFNWVLACETQPYNSYGNGSAMRVSAVAWYGKTLEEVEELARLTAEVTHNHPEGIKGAVVTAGSIFLARSGKSKEDIKNYIESFGYELNGTVKRYSKTNEFNETCQKTIPVAMQCFLEGESFEDVLRNSIAVGGDSDTIAAIAGSIAEGFYGVDDDIKEKVRINLDKDLYAVLSAFDTKYITIPKI